MAYHDSIIEDSRIRFSKQLEQIRMGCTVMVPRLSKEEINKYTGILKNTNTDERRPVLLEIGPALYELCSESDDDEEIVRRPVKITSSVRTISLTDSDDDEEPRIIAVTSLLHNSTSSAVALDEQSNAAVRNNIDTIPTNLCNCIENQRLSTTSCVDADNTYLPSTSATAIILNKNSSGEAGQKNVIESECKIIPSSPAKDIDSDKNQPLESSSKSVILSEPENRETSNIITLFVPSLAASEPVDTANSKEKSKSDLIVSRSETRETLIETNIDSDEILATTVKLKTLLTACSNQNVLEVISNENVSKKTSENDSIISDTETLETSIERNIDSNETSATTPKLNAPPAISTNLDASVVNSNRDLSIEKNESDTASSHNRARETLINNSPTSVIIKKINTTFSYPKVSISNYPRSVIMRDCTDIASNNKPTTAAPANSNTTSDTKHSNNETVPPVLVNLEQNGLTCTPFYSQKPTPRTESSLSVGDLFGKVISSIMPPTKPSDNSSSWLKKSSVILSAKPNQSSNQPEKSSVILSTKSIDQSPNRPEKSSMIPSLKPSDQLSNRPEKSSAILSTKLTDQPSNRLKNLSMPSLDLETSKQDSIPCSSVMQPLKLRVKSEAKLGIKNPEFSLLKPMSPVEVTAAVNQNGPEIDKNIARIAAQMKQQYLAKTAHDQRNRNFTKQSQDGKYTEMQLIDIDTEKNAYNNGMDRRYSEMILFLKLCIDHMNPISLFCQIYTKFQEIMPTNLKKQTVAGAFFEIIYHLLYAECYKNSKLHLRIPENEFCNVVSEVRRMFDLPMATTRKRTIPGATSSTQICNTPTISQHPQSGEVPNKVARAETSPYALISSERQPPAVNLISNQVAQNMSMTAHPRFGGPASHLGNSRPQRPTSTRLPVNYLNPQNIVHARSPPACNSNMIVRENIREGVHHSSFPELTRYLGSNSHVNSFPNPPPYPQTFVQPEITSNMIYQRNCNRPRELIHHQVISTETIVRPGTSDRLSSAGVHPSVSQSLSFHPSSGARMSPPVNPFSSIQPPVSTHQSHYVYPPATSRRNYIQNYAFNSIRPSFISPTTFEPYSNQYSQTVPTRMAPTSMNEQLYQPSNSWNNNQTTGKNLNSTNQGYLPTINNLNTNVRVPSTATTTPMQPSTIPHQTNRVTTVVERSQYVSTQVNGTPKNVYNVPNKSSQNLAFPSLPSFSSINGDKPLSVHVVNSSISPSTGSSPNLVSSSEMPISVPIVQSSSSPNIDQICDFERLGNMTEPFLKDSEFEEFMKTNDLNVRFDGDEHRNNVRLN